MMQPGSPSTEELELLQPGDLLAGRYRVHRVIGSGGMGVVVEAYHVDLAHRVAIKLLKPTAAKRASTLERFLQEARASVRLHGEHVARVTDVGRLEDGRPYIVMEYLHGRDLAQWIQEHGPMSVQQAVDLVLQASEAIAEAHSLGIVHRDLKPANLFLTQAPDGTPLIKVLDFGISKLMDPAALGFQDAKLTATSDVMGSPLYMSPEQVMSSKSVDGRSDIWSLGVILFEAITGTAPFGADTVPELFVRIATAEPRRLHEVRPDVPIQLSEVVAQCLAKDRAGRFPSVAKLAQALAPFGSPHALRSVESIVRMLGSAGMLSNPPPGSVDGNAADPAYLSTLQMPGKQAAVTPAGSGETTSAWSNFNQSVRRSSGLTVGIAVALAVGAALAVPTVLWLRSGSPDAAAPIQMDGSAPSAPASEAAPSLAAEPQPAVPLAVSAVASSSGEAAPPPVPARPPRPRTNSRKQEPGDPDPLADQR
jgi:serine/threonine protein kinase